MNARPLPNSRSTRLGHLAPDGILCLVAGINSGRGTSTPDPETIRRPMILFNEVVFGTVNANLRHYLEGAKALAKADPNWLDRLISRRVPFDRWQDALRREPYDVKTVIAIGEE